MKIGIDAKWYFEGPPSGKRVVRSLVDHLLKIDQQNEYFIFLNQKHKNEPFPPGARANVRLCYVWAGNNMLSNLFVLPYFSNRHRLDVVLYQNFISLFGKAKKIAYIHDVLFLSNPEYYTVYERLYFSPLKFLTRRADSVITVSEEEKKRLLLFNFSDGAEKITVAHHGVDATFMPRESHGDDLIKAVKQKFGIPDTFILFVGRLNLRKNVEHLLRAIPLLQNTQIPLVIVGADNWKKSNHEQIVKGLNIADRILFTGAVYKELPVIYSAATVFCFPSYAESFGLPPLEAMASGVPVVVSGTTSLPEVCGDAGTYINPNQAGEIASAIDNLLANDHLYAQKRMLGLERAKMFTWERATGTVLKCIESTVKYAEA